MPISGETPSFQVDRLRVRIFGDKAAAGRAAAADAAGVIAAAIQSRGQARIMVGTGNSQIDLIDALVREPGVDWTKVEGFHLDEYVGIAADHPAAFRLWIRTRFAEKARPRAMHYLEGDARDLEAALRNYAAALARAPVDLAFVGIGENGHIAFNDPPIADFSDPLLVRRVTLDEACRRQQVGEGHFPSFESVPREALTVTCSGLFRAKHWICCVPEGRKARAIKAALEGPISTACPGSLARRHPDARLYLDPDSSALLSRAAGRP
jgi:glucosamine-6-phosphate deaminase